MVVMNSLVLLVLRKSHSAGAFAEEKALRFVELGGGCEAVEIPEGENRYRRGGQNFQCQPFKQPARIAVAFALPARLRRKLRDDGLRDFAE